MNWRFFINGNQVFPKNGGIELYEYEKSTEPGSQFKFDLNSEFIFNYNDIGFNFKNQEQSNLCDELEFQVQRRCGNSWAIWWEGFFSISEGDFDDQNCIYKVTPHRKDFLIDDLEVNLLSEPNLLFEGGQYGITGLIPSSGFPEVYKNWRHFDKVVLFVAQKSNPKIKGFISNFFQVNPDGPYPLPGTNYFTKMVFTSLSEIKDPIPSNRATKEDITFKQLMTDLAVLFYVQWFIDENYNLRIEHVTYFEGSIGLDLTDDRYEKYIRGKNKYSYNMSDYLKKENFKIIDHKSSCSLIYSGLSNIAKNENEKTYTTQKIRTGWIEAHESTTPGVFLCATDGGSLSGDWRALLNAGPVYELYLNPKYLTLTVQPYLRPGLYALFYYYQNNSDPAVIAAGLILNSVKATKQQEELSIPLCCNDTFNIIDQIVTPMGVGYVNKAGFDAKTELLKIILKYKADDCSGFIPSDLSCNIALWLQYNDVVISPPFGKVSQWNDSSGNGRHAKQLTSIQMPVYASNTPLESGAIQFYNQNDPDFPPQFGMNLKTKAFQLFPNKRGTIFIVFNSGFGKFGGTGSKLTSSIGTGSSILSTQDGGTDNYFDISGNVTFNSFIEGVNYPQGPGYIGTPGFVSFADLGSNSVMVIRRSNDNTIDVSWNGIPSPNNPMYIANSQPDSKPLVIGFNDQINTYTSDMVITMSELLVYDCALTDDEIEKVLFYFIKKKLLTI